MASSSFDISGLSDLSSASIEVEDVQPRTYNASRSGGRPGTSVGRVPGSTAAMGRPQRALGDSSSSIELSQSDLSGSIEIEPSPVTSAPSQRPTTSGRPPQAGRSQPRPALATSHSSLEISGSDLSGSIEIDHDSSSQLPTMRVPTASRPTTSGRPPPAPGRPSAPSAGWGSAGRRAATAGGGHSRSPSGSLSFSTVSDDLSADLEISGGGGLYGSRPRGPNAEILNLDGPKATMTRAARASTAQGIARQTTLSLELSGAESLDLSGSLEIDHSGDQRPSAARIDHSGTQQQQQPARYVQDSSSVSTVAFSDSDIEHSLSVVDGSAAPNAARATSGGAGRGSAGGGKAGVAAPVPESLSQSYDAAVLHEGSSGGDVDISSGSIDYGDSVLTGGGPVTTSGARPPTGRAQPPPPFQRSADTPSLSGSSFVSESASDQSLGRTPAAGNGSRAIQPDSPSRRLGSSARLSRPHSTSGLTAEPVFASGSSRSGGGGTPSLRSGGGGTPSLRSGGSSGRGGSDSSQGSGGGGRRHLGGEMVIDASELLAASAVLAGQSYDTYGSAVTGTQGSARGGGGGAVSDISSLSGRSNSWDNSVGSGGEAGGGSRDREDSGSGGSGSARRARGAAGSKQAGRCSDGSESPVREVLLSASSLESSGEAFQRPAAPQGRGGAPDGGRGGSGGRRLGRSGDAGSRSSSESSYAVGGVRLRGMDELETSAGEEQQSQVAGTSYNVSYGDESEQQRQTQTEMPVQRGGAGRLQSDGGASSSRGREVVRYSNAPSTDSSLAAFRPPQASISHLSASMDRSDRNDSGVRSSGGGRSGSSTTSRSSTSKSSRSSKGSGSESGTGSRSSAGGSGSVDGSSSQRSGRGAGGSPSSSNRSRGGSRPMSRSGSGLGSEDSGDPLAGLQVVREGSGSGSSSSGENILTLDQLQAVEEKIATEQTSSRHTSRSSRTSGSGSTAAPVAGQAPSPALVSPAGGGDSTEYNDDFTTESVATESIAASRALSRAASSLRADSIRRRPEPGTPQVGRTEFSFSGHVGGSSTAAAQRHEVAGAIAEASSGERSAASSASGAAAEGMKALLHVHGDEDARTVPRPPPPPPPPRQQPAGPFPDPRLDGGAGRTSGSYSFSSVEEVEEVMSSAVRSPRAGQSSWPQPSESERSSPSLSRRERRRYAQNEDADGDGGIPSRDYDASASRSLLSQSGALGVAPVAPGWATSGGQQGKGAAPDPYQYSRDSDLSEEFIPSQAMQRALMEQPIFRPLMPNVPTPRASTGSPVTVPAFTARGVRSPDPRVSDPAGAAAAPAHQHVQPQPQSQPQAPPPHPQPHQPPQRQVRPPEVLSPAVAAAAAPPPPRTAFAATQTDVYSLVVDLDPIPRPGTVKLRTVGMQWGTLNEAATQVCFDPGSKQLLEGSSHTREGPEEGPSGGLPPHLRHQLHHHMLQQQQLYGAFTKRGAAGGWPSSLLQAGADSVLGEASPLSGIGPGFGILSLAFHSVKTAAMLEQLERSLSSAAAAASVAAPPAYLPQLAVHGAAPPYYPYAAPSPAWWPQPAAPQPHQTAGQVAAAAYAAATAAAAQQQQPVASAPSPASTSHGTATAGAATPIAAATGSAERGGPGTTSVTTLGTSRATSPLPLSPASRLRAVSTSVALSDDNSSSAVFTDRRATMAAAAAAAVAAHDATVAAEAAVASAQRHSHLSSVSSFGGAAMASGLPSTSPAGPRYASSAGARPSESSVVYSEDFEDAEEIVEEESGVRGSGSGSGRGNGKVGGVRLNASGVESSVLEEELVDDETEEIITEESDGAGSNGGSENYSEDFEPDSLPAVRSTASILTRSVTIGSGSRSRLNPALSNNSFSGRSLLRRGSVVVPTLAPISGSEIGSKDEDEDGPSLGSRVLNRVGSIIKSSSGFKRTASISITMADDPMLPNQMARILPTHTFAGNISGGGTVGAQSSARQLSVDESLRDKHTAAGGAAAGGSGQAHTEHHPPGLAAGGQLPGAAGAAPPGAYPPYYPYAPYSPYGPYPYGMPYGMPYPPPPPQPYTPAAASPANVASVLQYLPPPIPVPSGMYFYPPASPQYPTAVPGPGAAGSSHPAAAEGATTAARPHGVIVSPGAHPHHHHLHNMHVKFADGSGPGTDLPHTAPAAEQAPVDTKAASARLTRSMGTAPAAVPGSYSPVPGPGMAPHAYQQHQHQLPSAAGTGFSYGHAAQLPGSLLGRGGFGMGSSPVFTAQSTLQRFGSVLKSGAYPGLDPGTLHTIRTDLIKTAAVVSGQIGYEDIVAEQGAADEYRAQLARVRARLAAARATLPSVIPNQDKVLLVRTTSQQGQPPPQSPTLAAAAAAIQAQVQGQATASTEGGGGTGAFGGGSRILAVSTPAPGSFRYTTLEDTRRLIDATLPYAVVGAI